MKKSMFAAILVMVAVLGITPAYANFMTNGDFETGDLTGWTTNGVGITVHPTAWALDSNYAAEISPHDQFASLTQFVPTDPGKSYELSYYLRSAGGTNEFKADIDGSTYSYLQNFGQDYTLYTLYFTASSLLTEITFSSQQEFGAFLDNVSVVPAPEPATLVLLGAGLLGAGFARRKANR